MLNSREVPESPVRVYTGILTEDVDTDEEEKWEELSTLDSVPGAVAGTAGTIEATTGMR